jgi:hypothetical protein
VFVVSVQVAAALRDADAAFPGAAAPGQPIKLPRQHNVDKEEYKEFLNLGHGEIFSLELDRCGQQPNMGGGCLVLISRTERHGSRYRWGLPG